MSNASYQVLIVCAANTCRSVIAEWLLKKLLKERGIASVAVVSGGIAPFARDGSLVSLEARLVLREEGIELPDEAVSTDLKRHPELIADSDLILAMTNEQKALITGMPEADGKEVATFREYAGGSGDIADPFSQGEVIYQQRKEEIKSCAAKIVDRIAKTVGAPRGTEGSLSGLEKSRGHKPAPLGLSGWERLESRVVYQCRLFSVLASRNRFGRDGSEHEFYHLEAQDWVNIIPLTSDERVVMVRQYRHGISGFTLEIPGGLIDPEDRSLLVAARREMVEETGYDSDQIQAIGFVHPNPAIQANRCYSFVARDVVQTGLPEVGLTEETQVELIRLSDVGGLVRKGLVTHALVIAAFQCLRAQMGN